MVMSSDHKWHELTLNDVCSKITDGAHLSPKSVETGLQMASVKDLTPFGINLDSCRQISKEDFDKLTRQGCQPIAGDVLIAKDGASALDTVCVMKRTLDVVLLSSVAILRPDKAQILPSFLRYYLDSETTRSYMKSAFTTGAAIPRVVLKDFKLARIKLPPLPTQRKIAAILSAYDDLIENNTRRIQILEEMAQVLYREWFVNFRYPGHEKVQMEESELGPKPEGWEVSRLDDALVLQRGFDLPKKKRHDGEIPIYASTGIVGTHDEAKVKGPGVVTGRSGSLGTVLYIDEDFWPLNTTLWVKKFRRVTPIYAFYLLNNLDLRAFNSGAAVPTLNRNDVHGLPVILPPNEVLVQFDHHVTSLFAMNRNLIKRSLVLSRTRDLLLPKLISGEIDLSKLRS